ncbi:unnamed protein product [Heterobilharzia americana]|nr:unnamed protein product [Heterobilharzia americana]
MNFTQHTINLLAGAQIIFYAIDIRKKDNRIFNNTLDNSILLINPYHSEEERWNEVRIELNALTNCLTSTQILIILGIGDQYSNNNNNNDSNEYNLIELAINLGFGYKSCKDNEQKEEEIDKIQSNNNHHYQGIKPLDKAYLNWRLWCTTSDGTNYTNLEEIFFWTIITYLSKSSLVNRISDESLKNRIKTMQNRITNYYRALFV